MIHVSRYICLAALIYLFHYAICLLTESMSLLCHVFLDIAKTGHRLRGNGIRGVLETHDGRCNLKEDVEE